jgi:hypothetical protein
MDTYYPFQEQLALGSQSKNTFQESRFSSALTLSYFLLPSRMCEEVLGTWLEDAPDFRHLNFENTPTDSSLSSPPALSRVRKAPRSGIFSSALALASTDDSISGAALEHSVRYHKGCHAFLSRNYVGLCNCLVYEWMNEWMNEWIIKIIIITIIIIIIIGKDKVLVL